MRVFNRVFRIEAFVSKFAETINFSTNTHRFYEYLNIRKANTELDRHFTPLSQLPDDFASCGGSKGLDFAKMALYFSSGCQRKLDKLAGKKIIIRGNNSGELRRKPRNFWNVLEHFVCFFRCETAVEKNVKAFIFR